MAFAWKASGLTYVTTHLGAPPALNWAVLPLEGFQLTKLLDSYNKYLSVAARVVRRSLKDEQRLQAEKRGQMELRFAKWNVSA